METMMTDATQPQGKTVKACLDHRPNFNEEGVAGNYGYDASLSIPDVIAREEADGTLEYRGHSVRNLSHGHVDLYFTPRRAVVTPLEPREA